MELTIGYIIAYTIMIISIVFNIGSAIKWYNARLEYIEKLAELKGSAEND